MLKQALLIILIINISHISAFQFIHSSLFGIPKEFDCSKQWDELKSTQNLYLQLDDENYLFIGQQQANKNPILSYFVEKKQVWCQTDIQVIDKDQRQYGGIYYKSDTTENLYLIFSSTAAQSTEPKDISNFTQNGWFKTYSSTNVQNSKVSVVAQLNVKDGKIITGSYIQSANTNAIDSNIVKSGCFADNKLILQIDSAIAPVNDKKQLFICSGTPPYQWWLALEPNLNQAFSSCVQGCTDSYIPSSCNNTYKTCDARKKFSVKCPDGTIISDIKYDEQEVSATGWTFEFIKSAEVPVCENKKKDPAGDSNNTSGGFLNVLKAFIILVFILYL